MHSEQVVLIIHIR